MKLLTLAPLALLVLPALAAAPASAICEPAACAQLTYEYVLLEYGRLSSTAHNVAVVDGGALAQSTYGTVVTCSGRWVGLLVQEPTSGRIVPVTVECGQREAGHAGVFAGRVAYNAGVVARFVPEDAQRYAAALLA